MADRRDGISNNGLAGLFSAEFLAGAIGIVFAIGVAYNTLAGGIATNKEIIDKHSQAIEMLEQTQIGLRTDVAEIKSTQKYQLMEQQKIRDRIDRILDILGEQND